MLVVAIGLVIARLGGAAAGSPTWLQSAQAASPAGDCAEWRECRQLAVAAADRGDYETFHDLAWRAVQKGPPKDPSLMYLLARAQALSGRPHDALIMLLRLAEMGVATDAATNEDFHRTRQLPGWAEAEAKIAGTARSDSAPVAAPAARSGSVPTGSTPAGSVPSSSPVSSARPTSPASAPISAVALTPAAAGLRFSTSQFAISGLAYDALSLRFVLGDRLGRRLVLVDERSNQTMDLVRADSAGFLDIAAVEIDAKRGDLWVASTDEGAGTLHRLQLVSGRPIRAFGVAPDLEPVKLADLSIASTGTVVVLDSRTPRLFVLRPRATSLEPVVRIDVQDATSVAAGGDDRTAFVAHRDGISRIDLQTRAISPVAVPNGLSLRRLERIRWQGSALVAIQLDDDGSRRVFRLEMNPRGTAITKAVGLNVPAPIGDQAFVTISGNDLLYLTSDPAEADGPQASASRSRAFVAYRVPLQ